MQGQYNKVSGLDNAKQIWDTHKISHEGNNVTMITKMELVEGELGRFAMKRGDVIPNLQIVRDHSKGEITSFIYMCVMSPFILCEHHIKKQLINKTYATKSLHHAEIYFCVSCDNMKRNILKPKKGVFKIKGNSRI
jgi:hypothetical protein